MRGPMKLVDVSTGGMECRVCGSSHMANLKHGGFFHYGSYQCCNESCPSNQKVFDGQRDVKPNWRALVQA
jgi:hypothetical protein